jgi:site-specific DNA recombinase
MITYFYQRLTRAYQRTSMSWLVITTAYLCLLVMNMRPELAHKLVDHCDPARLLAGVGHVLARRGSRRRQPAEAAASYSRFSSELQNETSIEIQQSSCRDAAARESRSIAVVLEFADRAVSGTKLNREGLNALMAAAEAGQFNTIYFYSLSRLARESIISMPILKRLVHVLKIRVISITEGVDSNREGWEMAAQILSMQHERYIKELSANVHNGQKANVQNGYSNGDYCFGYISVPVPGTEQTRRGRHARPRMVYAIDPETAPWVVRIFDWFAIERRPLRWLSRELNHLDAPKDHRATTKHWHHQYLVRLLSNRKYIGIWPWGEMKNVRDPSTGIVSQEERPTDVSEAWVREFPGLRLIDDETFGLAQQYLLENVEKYAHCHDEKGKFNRDQQGAAEANPTHLLSGLIVCGHCDRSFYVGGAFGKYLFCPGYHQGVCPCQTTLNRRLAESLILHEVSKRLLANPTWVQSVLDFTLTSWCERQRTLPNELRDTENALAEANRKISALLDAVEDQDENHRDPDLQQRLQQRRAERRQHEDRLAELKAKASQAPQEPTMEWVSTKILNLHDVLSTPTPAAAFALRELVGGRIVVEEIREQGRKRFFLRGSFSFNRLGILNSLNLPVEPEALPPVDESEVITIDFVRPDPLTEKAEKAKALWDQGLLNVQIAAVLECSRSMVTKLLKHWSALHGVELINGHARRAQLEQQHVELPLYKRIADEVMRRVDAQELLQDIAAALGVDRNTISASIRWWHEARGLPVPDGRPRRKTLARKSSDDQPASCGGSAEAPSTT